MLVWTPAPLIAFAELEDRSRNSSTVTRFRPLQPCSFNFSVFGVSMSPPRDYRKFLPPDTLPIWPGFDSQSTTKQRLETRGTELEQKKPGAQSLPCYRSNLEDSHEDLVWELFNIAVSARKKENSGIRTASCSQRSPQIRIEVACGCGWGNGNRTHLNDARAGDAGRAMVSLSVRIDFGSRWSKSSRLAEVRKNISPTIVASAFPARRLQCPSTDPAFEQPSSRGDARWSRFDE